MEEPATDAKKAPLSHSREHRCDFWYCQQRHSKMRHVRSRESLREMMHSIALHPRPRAYAKHGRNRRVPNAVDAVLQRTTLFFCPDHFKDPCDKSTGVTASSFHEPRNDPVLTGAMPGLRADFVMPTHMINIDSVPSDRLKRRRSRSDTVAAATAAAVTKGIEEDARAAAARAATTAQDEASAREAAEAHLHAIVTEAVEEQSKENIVIQAVLERISDLERENTVGVAEVARVQLLTQRMKQQGHLHVDSTDSCNTGSLRT